MRVFGTVECVRLSTTIVEYTEVVSETVSVSLLHILVAEKRKNDEKSNKKKEKAKKGRQVCSSDTIHLSFIGRGPPLRSIFFEINAMTAMCNVISYGFSMMLNAPADLFVFAKRTGREKAAKMHLFALANKLLSMYLICQLLSPLARVIKFSDTQP